MKLTDSPERHVREGPLVDCTESMDTLTIATQKFPDHPIVAVLSETETKGAMEALARGADGVIALRDPPAMWRECLNVVLGGGRWLGGPGLDVQFESEESSHYIATGRRHRGDVTLRTKLFVRDRLADKPGNDPGRPARRRTNDDREQPGRALLAEGRHPLDEIGAVTESRLGRSLGLELVWQAGAHCGRHQVPHPDECLTRPGRQFRRHLHRAVGEPTSSTHSAISPMR